MAVRAGTWLLALSAVLAAGCSGDERSGSLPVLPSSTPSAAPSTSPPVAFPGADQDSAEAASAFVRYFLAEANEAYASGMTDELEALSGPACTTCANIIEDVRRLSGLGNAVSGDRFKLNSVVTAPALADGSFIVDFRFSSDPYVERRADGEIARSEPAQLDQDAQARVRRLGGKWQAAGLRYVPA